MKPPLNLISFDGLGTHWECEIIKPEISSQQHDEIKHILVDRLNEFTNLYSRFDSKSLIGKLNSKSKIKNPPKEMREMMQFARKMYHISQGVFDISVGGVLAANGYGLEKDAAKISRNFWENTIVSDKIIKIPVGAAIDFGGFGKGWLIDVFVKMLSSYGLEQFIVNGGGDLYVNSSEPIDIILEHPTDSTMTIGKTQISNGALAVSSTVKRAWSHDGIWQHHIINPITGMSSDTNIINTFVKASTALMADTMATILIIRPDLNDYLSKKFELKTILLSADQIKN